jgi:hypothetical protein
MAEQSKQPQIAVTEAIYLLRTFRGADLTQTVYQIEKSALLYLHRGTKEGTAALGLRGETLDAAALPAAFSRLTPAEIEDCLCIYKDTIRGVDRARGKSGCRVVGRRRRYWD